MRATFSVVIAASLAFHFAACAPSPNGPRLDTNRAEVQVREAFAESLDVVRRGSPQQVMSTLADDFVFKTESGTLVRDAAAARLPADRQIIKFDKVSPDSVVMTSDDSNRRYIEIWVRTASGWKLARMNELATYAIHS
jgi:ketosteroid isomerase-like protein